MRDDQVRRYARHILLPDIGGVGQRRLLAARIRVHLGARCHAASAALAYLAAAGVGTLEILEDEPGRTITAADIAGSVLFEQQDLGSPLIDAIRARLAALNPDVSVVSSGVGDEPAPPSAAPGATLRLGDHGADRAAALVQGCAAAVQLLYRLANPAAEHVSS